MTPKARALMLWIAATTVACFGVWCLAAYRPAGATDRVRALASLKHALASLNDESLESRKRVAAYRDGLSETDALLRHVIRTNPADTASIERLATVRWEAGVLAGNPDADSVLPLMEIAATRAPRVPEIQANLGDLLCKMGRTDQAAPFMRRAVKLSPTMTSRVVATMDASGVLADDIVATLPPILDVLIAVKDIFVDSGRGLDYLTHVERQLVVATPSLLATYGDACLQLDAPARLRDRIGSLPPTQDPTVRAERSCQIAHAWLSLGDPNHALVFADEARRTMPQDPRLLEFYGEVALASGRFTEAETAFRRSLEIRLTKEAAPAARARLYDAIGRSLEAQGRADLAYDAFRRAVDIDPSQKHAEGRLATYEHRMSENSR